MSLYSKEILLFLDDNYVDTTGKTEQRMLVKVIWSYRSILREYFNANHEGIYTE